MGVVTRSQDKTSGTQSGRNAGARTPLRLVDPGAGEPPGSAAGSAHRKPRSAGHREASPPGRSAAVEATRDRVQRGSDTERSQTAPARVGRSGTREWQARAETVAAAGLAAHDARWVTAARATQAIEGGRAAVLRPEVRARLVSSAERMGLRPFDANLVLAIVQDAARQGKTIQDADTVDRLALVRGRAPRGRKGGGFALLCVGLSAMWAVLLVWWLRG